MRNAFIDAIEKAQVKTDLPQLSIGDTVDVHCRIIEGEKERVQVFSGVIIMMAGSGLTRNITVRRIVANEGVERTFPLNSPKVSRIEVTRHGHVRRAKLYYLRDRIGKSRRLKDRRRGLEQPGTEAAVTETAKA
ncbi:MAG: 50S ribosomal protein L19 [Phycisphaeraceae bacterium]